MFYLVGAIITFVVFSVVLVLVRTVQIENKYIYTALHKFDDNVSAITLALFYGAVWPLSITIITILLIVLKMINDGEKQRSNQFEHQKLYTQIRKEIENEKC